MVLNDGCQRQVIEQVGEVLPDVGIAILAEALIIEAVDLGDLPTLVVASENRDSVLEAHLEAHEQRHGLHAVVSTIYVVSHEEIVCVWRATSDLEKLHEVVELSMHVTADCHGAFHRLHV